MMVLQSSESPPHSQAVDGSRPVAGFSNAWEAVTLRLSAVDPSILVRGVGSWAGGNERGLY